MIIRKIVVILLIVDSIYSASLKLNISKQNAYLNEPIIATLTLSYNKEENIRDIKSIEFKAKDIIAKVVSTKKVTNSINRLVIYNLQLFPKKTGTLFIPRQDIKISTFDKKLLQTSWKKIYSNENIIVVKDIPNNLDISGNLNIKANLNRKKYKSKEPIALTITIYGLGATDSIKPLKLNLQNQTIFNETPIIKEETINSKINNSFTQKFIIVAENNFTIPAIEFKYFNIDTQMVEYLSTKQINIEISTQKKSTFKSYYIVVSTILGFLFGVISTILLYKVYNNSRVKSSNLIINIKKSKRNKELYNRLLPYINRYKLDELLVKLEENIDTNLNLKQYKKEAITIVKKISIAS